MLSKTILQDRSDLREQQGASSGHFLSSEHVGGSANTLVAPSRAMPSGNKNRTIAACVAWSAENACLRAATTAALRRSVVEDMRGDADTQRKDVVESGHDESGLIHLPRSGLPGRRRLCAATRRPRVLEGQPTRQNGTRSNRTLCRSAGQCSRCFRRRSVE